MSTKTIRVCDDCGSQIKDADLWFQVNATVEISHWDDSRIERLNDVELCSPGCVTSTMTKLIGKKMPGEANGS